MQTEQTKNSKILEVYNGNEVIAGAGYAMTSNYLLPLLHRMSKEKIITKNAVLVTQTIFSFKFSKENPFISYPTICDRLGACYKTVSNAIKSIKEAGILLIEDASIGGKVNAYNFQPLFELLEKFIIEFKYNGNKDVKIADLMNIEVVREKSEHDFSWSEAYEKKETKIVPVPEEAKEEKPEETKEPKEEKPEEVAATPVVELPEKIVKILKYNKVNEEGIEAVRDSFETFGNDLHVDLFIEKIVHASNTKNFVAFYKTCINNAYKNNEKPTEAPAKVEKPEKKQYTKKTYIRTEDTPEWLKTHNEELARKTKEAEEARKTEETNKADFLKRKEALQARLRSKYGKDEKEASENN